MKLILLLLPGFFAFSTVAQNHAENLKEVTDLEEAKAYASKYNEVSVGLIHAEKDQFLFDDVDTSNMEASLGKSKDFYGRVIKFLKDTTLKLVNIQIIEFDPEKTNVESSDILVNQMQKRFDAGERYYDVRQKYKHTSANFSSSPEDVNYVMSYYGLSVEQLQAGGRFVYEAKDGSGKRGIIIVEKNPHFVPAFWVISFLDLNSNLR